jgi:hypothetical protein
MPVHLMPHALDTIIGFNMCWYVTTTDQPPPVTNSHPQCAMMLAAHPCLFHSVDMVQDLTSRMMRVDVRRHNMALNDAAAYPAYAHGTK